MAVVDDGPLDLARPLGRGRRRAAERRARRASIGDIADAETRCAAAACSRRSASATSSCPSSTARNSTVADPLPVAAGLHRRARRDQLDLSARRSRPPGFVVFENAAAMPTTAHARRRAGRGQPDADDLDVLVGVDTSTADAGARRRRRDPRRPTGDVAAGVVHVGDPARRRTGSWRSAATRGRRPRRRSASTTAFDVADRRASRAATIDQPLVADAVVLVGVGRCGSLVLLAASRLPVSRRGCAASHGRRDETLLDLDAEPARRLLPDAATGFGGWVDELLADERRRTAASEAADPASAVIVRRAPDARPCPSPRAGGIVRRAARDDARRPVAPAFSAAVPRAVDAGGPAGAALTTTWFCPGVPATGRRAVGGESCVANAGPSPMQASVTLLAGRRDRPVDQDVTVEPHAAGERSTSASVTTALRRRRSSRSTAAAGSSSSGPRSPAGTSVAAVRHTRRRRTGTSPRATRPRAAGSRSCSRTRTTSRRDRRRRLRHRGRLPGADRAAGAIRAAALGAGASTWADRRPRRAGGRGQRRGHAAASSSSGAPSPTPAAAGWATP